ncbi:hypothetical protein [Roseivirga pacifica]|uniref:hypothetical protein n=1 Tax=Roseivirga pacifica TaxID=1267423 RepID=UPI003BAB2D58
MPKTITHTIYYSTILTLFLCTDLLGQNVLHGTLEEVYAEITADAAREAGKKFAELVDAKTQFTKQAEQARRKYWQEYAKGKVSEQTTTHFANILLEKDLYYFGLQYMSRMMKDLGIDYQYAQRKFQALDRISGGELDDGYLPYVKMALNNWVNNVYENQRKQSGSLLDDSGILEKVVSRYPEEYKKFAEVRNYAEYWNISPISPLKAATGEELFRSLFSLYRTGMKQVEVDQFFADIKKYASEENITKGAELYKEHSVASYSQEEFTNFVINLNIFSKPNTNSAERLKITIATYIGAYDKSLLPISLIYATTNFPFSVCEEIHQRRITRYGKEKMEQAVLKAIKDPYRCTLQFCKDDVGILLDGKRISYIDSYEVVNNSYNGHEYLNIPAFKDGYQKLNPNGDFNQWLSACLKYYNEDLLNKAIFYYQGFGEYQPRIGGSDKNRFPVFEIFKAVAHWSDYLNNNLAVAAYSLSELNKEKDLDENHYEWILYGVKELDRIIKKIGTEQVEYVVEQVLESHDRPSSIHTFSFWRKVVDKLYELAPRESTIGLDEIIEEFKASAKTQNLSHPEYFSLPINEAFQHQGEVIYSNNGMTLTYYGQRPQEYQGEKIYETYVTLDLDKNEPLDVFRSRVEHLVWPLYNKLKEPSFYFIRFFKINVAGCQIKNIIGGVGYWDNEYKWDPVFKKNVATVTELGSYDCN